MWVSAKCCPVRNPLSKGDCLYVWICPFPTDLFIFNVCFQHFSLLQGESITFTFYACYATHYWFKMNILEKNFLKTWIGRSGLFNIRKFNQLTGPAGRTEVSFPANPSCSLNIFYPSLSLWKSIGRVVILSPKAAINIIIDVVAMSRLEIDLTYLEIAILNT